MVHAVYALLAAAAFDARPWLDDFRQLTAEMSAHYANLDWAIEHRRMDLPKLREGIEACLRAATSEQEARAALQRFVDVFGDGHLTIEWPRPDPPSATVALEWYDVDFKRGQLTVRRGQWEGEVVAPKGGRSRVVPMTEALKKALAAGAIEMSEVKNSARAVGIFAERSSFPRIAATRTARTKIDPDLSSNPSLRRRPAPKTSPTGEQVKQPSAIERARLAANPAPLSGRVPATLRADHLAPRAPRRAPDGTTATWQPWIRSPAGRARRDRGGQHLFEALHPLLDAPEAKRHISGVPSPRPQVPVTSPGSYQPAAGSHTPPRTASPSTAGIRKRHSSAVCRITHPGI